ncbi:MAG: diacylglycerol kinase [Candidatus Spechtbacterales bacterium]
MKEDPSYYKEYSHTPLIDRFIHATRGIKNAWRKEPNFRIEAFVALLVFGAMLVLPLSNTERAVLVLVIALVLALEIVNSIFERVLDIIHPDFSEEVKKIKDTMAGVVLLASISSVIVGLFILTRPMINFDKFFHTSLESFRTDIWVNIAGIVSILGDWQSIVGIAAVLSVFLAHKKRHELLSFLVGATGIGAIFLYFLKWVFERQRPVAAGFNSVSDYSFPSGHVFMGTVLFFSVAFILSQVNYKKVYVWSVSVAVVLLIALSRVVLSAHWLSDIFGGFVFGVFWLLLWYGINHRLWNRELITKKNN